MEEEPKTTEAKPTNPTKTNPSWRQLSLTDIPSLARIAAQIHPNLPESDEVFAERVKLFPKGCLALVVADSDDDDDDDGHDELCGYAISHPIRHHRQPPALNSLLGEISPGADQYYIHDLAILPQFRGHGFAQECVQHIIIAVASRFATIGLVSVYGTAAFWGRFGFLAVGVDEVLGRKLRDCYGDDAVYLERRNEEDRRLAGTEMGSFVSRT